MINIKDIHWAAGFMEGEGSFCSSGKSLSFQISAEQTILEPLEKLVALFGGNISPRYNNRYTNGVSYRWYCSGAKAAGIMLTLYSLMTEKRKLQIKNAYGKWIVRPVRNSLKTHCKRGHEYNDENTYIRPEKGSRECRKCIRLSKAMHRKRRRLWATP